MLCSATIIASKDYFAITKNPQSFKDELDLPLQVFISSTLISLLGKTLLLGRKVMTNLDSILKSRHITLSTKFRLVKAMVFPVVMYGCESWTIKKAEGQRIDAFQMWC